MKDAAVFESREAFRLWLEENCLTSEGVWLLFGKAGGPATLSAGEALEEALCFGWIDGQMKKLDETSYVKYFSCRRTGSRWSEKNKTLAAWLEAEGKMTDFGRAKIAEAKGNGQWNAEKPADVGEKEMEALAALIKGHEPAYANFMAMPPSVKRTYTRGYFAAKTEEGRKRRLAWTIDRLDRNLRPM